MIWLPWPPSANRYWRSFRGRVIVSAEARKYKEKIKMIALQDRVECLTGRLSILIHAHPPDKRKRDIDNIIKVLLDSLQDARYYINDSQIDKITIERMFIQPPGVIFVDIQEILKSD